MTHYTQRSPQKTINRFLNRNLVGYKEWEEIFKVLKDKLQTKITTLSKLFFKNEGEIKTFPEKEKLKKFITTTPPLLEMLKEVPV